MQARVPDRLCRWMSLRGTAMFPGNLAASFHRSLKVAALCWSSGLSMLIGGFWTLNASLKICSRFPLVVTVLFVSLLCANRGAAQKTSDGAGIAGDWAATLSVDGSELHLALHIVAGRDG